MVRSLSATAGLLADGNYSVSDGPWYSLLVPADRAPIFDQCHQPNSLPSSSTSERRYTLQNALSKNNHA